VNYGTSARVVRFSRMTKHALVLAFGLMAAVEGAAAQAPPSATTPSQPIASALPTELAANCAPTAAAPSRGTVTVPPDGTTTGQGSEPLSDKLTKSDGVLCPPAGVDPEIHAPTPDAGNTPVIPPPGSPGGNPDIQPK
jgi:hypothetical protein